MNLMRLVLRSSWRGVHVGWAVLSAKTWPATSRRHRQATPGLSRRL